MSAEVKPNIVRKNLNCLHKHDLSGPFKPCQFLDKLCSKQMYNMSSVWTSLSFSEKLAIVKLFF